LKESFGSVVMGMFIGSYSSFNYT